MQKKQPTVLFLISPSFGLLDNWLPIFWELKKRRPDTKLIALIPKTQTVLEIDPTDVTIQLGEAVFDEVIFKSRAGFWVVAKSLGHARKLSEKSHRANLVIGKMRIALQLSYRFILVRPVVVLVNKVFEYIAPMFTNETHVKPENISTNVKAICFDVYVKTKKDCRDVLKYFPTTPRFSILHGLAVADHEVKSGNMDAALMTYKTTAYLFSKHEISTYERNYGLKDSEIKVVGVPRHDPDWIRTVLRSTKNDIPPSWDRYIFVISRPVVEGFFPYEKKRNAIEDIKKLAFEDLHARVVVRFHPTERRNNEGVYEEVFGKESYGQTWMYSLSHPFVIGNGSLFALTFYSGVAIDMLALGVPTIQISDFTGGGKMGAIIDYKKMGLVLGASNYGELKNQAHRILKEKEKVLEELMPSYNEYFRPVGNPVHAIADDILKVL